MNTQHVLVETLTPLHVGSGRMLQGNTEYLYFQNERTVAVVDERKILEIIGEANLERWVDIIGKGTELLEYLETRKPGVKPVDTSRRVLSVVGKSSPGGNQTIREQLFSGNGQPILPGSSLKGAIRTAVLNALIRLNPTAARDIRAFKQVEDRQDFRTGHTIRKVKYKGGSLEKKYTGPDPNHDVFRLLRIGDIHFEQTVCLLSETLNELGNSNLEMKDSVKQFIECIPAGAETICRVQIPAELKARLNETRYREIADKIPHRDRMEWVSLLADINVNTKRLIQNELDRYQSQHLPAGANKYLDSLKGMMTGLKANQCVIRVGFGTGYLNMTGGWAEEQWRNVPGINYPQEMADLGEGVRRNTRYNSFELPKSRKMALGGVPLGFLKLTLFSESEWTDWQAQATDRAAEQERKAETMRVEEAKRRDAERLEAESQRIIDAGNARIAAEQEAKRQEEERVKKDHEKRSLFDGKPKKGIPVNAEVVAVSGAKATLKLYVTGQETERLFLVYNGLSVGDFLSVEIRDVSGKGKIMAVGFKAKL
ncbi:type III-A CRISPR-associated RAMP protein Csm5 [Spirosoma areae]